VRYSKWRAADINKALREGRQPTPVSAGGEQLAEATTVEPTSASAPPPISPFVPTPPVSPPAVLTEVPEAPSAHEEPYSTSVLPAVSAAFGEGDSEIPFEMITPSSAPAPIDASDPQAEHLILTGSPEPPSPPTLSQLPPAVDMDMEQGRGRSTSISAAPLTPPPTTRPQRSISPTHFLSRDSPPPPASYNIANAYPSAPPLPPLPPSAPYVQIPAPSAPPLIETSPPVELTPGQIAKTQKHCRFAISALDYEDVEQARKELRAALAILDG
jgi:vacuolar protein sorting-associated protein VTA1